MSHEGKLGEGNKQGEGALSGALIRENAARAMFQKYDKNASGRIDANELAALFADLGTSFDSETLRRFDSSGGEGKLAGSGDGELDFNEFVRLYNQVLEPKVFKVLMLGLDNGGKSMIMKALYNKMPTNMMPTNEMNVEIVTSGACQLQLIEFGGMKAIREPRPHLKVGGVDGMIFVVDSADEWRMGKEARDELSTLHGEFGEEVPVLVLANKQDLLNALDVDQVRQKLGIPSLITTSCGYRPHKVQGCSVLSQHRDSLASSLEWLGERISDQKQLKTKSSKFSHK